MSLVGLSSQPVGMTIVVSANCTVDATCAGNEPIGWLGTGSEPMRDLGRRERGFANYLNLGHTSLTFPRG